MSKISFLEKYKDFVGSNKSESNFENFISNLWRDEEACSVIDSIILEFAESNGCDVHEGAAFALREYWSLVVGRNVVGYELNLEIRDNHALGGKGSYLGEYFPYCEYKDIIPFKDFKEFLEFLDNFKK